MNSLETFLEGYKLFIVPVFLGSLLVYLNQLMPVGSFYSVNSSFLVLFLRVVYLLFK